MTANSLPTGVSFPCFSSAGPVQIWASTGASAAMECLGATRNGISINEQPFLTELKSDLSGGEQGPPGDFQWLGEAHAIDAELAQFSAAVLAKLGRRVNASIASRTKGMLIGCSGGAFRVLFLSANFVRNYTRVFITDPVIWAPLGTPATFPRIQFYGLEDPANTDSSPWNTTYTAGSGTIT